MCLVQLKNVFVKHKISKMRKLAFLCLLAIVYEIIYYCRIFIGGFYYLGVAVRITLVVSDGGGAIVVEINDESVWHYPIGPVEPEYQPVVVSPAIVASNREFAANSFYFLEINRFYTIIVRW